MRETVDDPVPQVQPRPHEIAERADRSDEQRADNRVTHQSGRFSFAEQLFEPRTEYLPLRSF